MENGIKHGNTSKEQNTVFGANFVPKSNLGTRGNLNDVVKVDLVYENSVVL